MLATLASSGNTSYVGFRCSLAMLAGWLAMPALWEFWLSLLAMLPDYSGYFGCVCWVDMMAAFVGWISCSLALLNKYAG
jgi:hypothetical protein